MTDSLTPRYAGKKSKAFWRRVRRIKDETAHSIAYNAGCLLQNIESTALNMVKEAEAMDRLKREDTA